MTWTSILALAGAMFILAITPGPGVFSVVARTSASGFAAGLTQVAGIVCADFAFILLAVYGMSAIAELLGSLFVIVKYLGGAYLIWLGIQLWRKRPKTLQPPSLSNKKAVGSHFLTGFVVTMSNPKAIFFYMGFFPAFVDLTRITTQDIGIILIVTVISIGGVMSGYAYATNRARQLFNNSRTRQRLDRTAGSIMIGTGAYMIARN